MMQPGEWKIEYRLRKEGDPATSEFRYGKPDSHPVPHKGDSFTVEGKHYECMTVHVDYDVYTIRVYGTEL